MTMRLAPLGALLAVLLLSLTACSLFGSAEEEENRPTGPVCGFFDKSVLVDFVGHDGWRTDGGGMRDREFRSVDAATCMVTDERTQSIRVIATTSDVGTPSALAQLRGILRRGLDALPNCTRPPAIEKLGEGYACVDGDTLKVAVILRGEPRRFVRLTLTDAHGKATTVADAVTLIEDINANVEAYDREHGG